MRRRAAGSGLAGRDQAPPIVRDALTLTGAAPLSPAARDAFEPVFGHNFAGVRVRHDELADASARAVGAVAYTVGHQIVFRAGAYRPDTTDGRRLLAHELAHVVQSGDTPVGSSALHSLNLVPAGDPSERAAQSAAADAVRPGRGTDGAGVSPVSLGGARPAVRLQSAAGVGANPAPEAESALRHAQAAQNAGGILFDSWGNDVRDNDNDGHVDSGPERRTYDGEHYAHSYRSFGVVAGTYTRGWPDEHGVAHGTVTVGHTQTITGDFKYRVCADVVSQAFADAGLMHHLRSTAEIIDRFRRIGTVWHKSDGFPSEYLPGDFIGTYSRGHGGHSGIVVSRSSTSSTPTVIELPGPSTQADAGTYDPTSTNDVKQEPWSKQAVADQYQYLGRYTGGRLHHRHGHGGARH